MPDKKPFLSIVVPSYNEMSNINKGAIKQIEEFVGGAPWPVEVIFSDDGSTDGTLDELRATARRHPSTMTVLANKHAGKAPTVKAGMLAAKGEWRLFTDFDQSTPLKEVNKLLRYVPDFPVVIGSREMVGSKRDKEPWYRHLMGRGFNLVVQLFAVPGILDTQCGFKLFSAEATEQLFPEMVVYGGNKTRKDAFTGAFDVELLFLALKRGFAIREVPIIWHHHHTDRVSPIKDSIRMFKDILRIRLAELQGAYRAKNN